jgi:hypothetical protein
MNGRIFTNPFQRRRDERRNIIGTPALITNQRFIVQSKYKGDNKLCRGRGEKMRLEWDGGRNCTKGTF